MPAQGCSVLLACRVLAVSESGFYAQRGRPPSARAIRHALLTDVIGRVHLDSRGSYGARRVHAELTLGRVSWSVGVRSSGSCAGPGSPARPDVRTSGGSPTSPRPVISWNAGSGATSPTDYGSPISPNTPPARARCPASWCSMSSRDESSAGRSMRRRPLAWSPTRSAWRSRDAGPMGRHPFRSGHRVHVFGVHEASTRLGAHALDGRGREWLRQRDDRVALEPDAGRTPRPPAPSLEVGHASRVRDSTSDRDGGLTSSISTPLDRGRPFPSTGF